MALYPTRSIPTPLDSIRARLLKTKIKITHDSPIRLDASLSLFSPSCSLPGLAREPFRFTEKELAILRDARIPVPKFDYLGGLYYIHAAMSLRFSLVKSGMKYATSTKFSNHGLAEVSPCLESSGKIAIPSQTLDRVIPGRIPPDPFSDLLARVIGEAKARLVEVYNVQEESFHAEHEDLLEWQEQYQDECHRLRCYIDEYFHQSPALERIFGMKIVKQSMSWDEARLKEFWKISTWKPIYDPASNMLTMFDFHLKNVLHVNSNYSIHADGAVILHVNTMYNETIARNPINDVSNVKWDKWDNHHYATIYYLFPAEDKFYTANASKVKALGPFDKWDLSIRDCFGRCYEYEIDEGFRACYACGAKLHFPATPSRVAGAWVTLMKLCCKCYKRGMNDPDFLTRAVENFIATKDLTKSEKIRHLLGLDEFISV
jgi:hypothetical protein